MKETYGKFVFHKAAMEGNLELIKYLDNKDAIINQMDKYGQTPMLLAALKGYWKIVCYLHKKILIRKEKKAKEEHNFEFLVRVL